MSVVVLDYINVYDFYSLHLNLAFQYITEHAANINGNKAKKITVEKNCFIVSVLFEGSEYRHPKESNSEKGYDMGREKSKKSYSFTGQLKWNVAMSRMS